MPKKQEDQRVRITKKIVRESFLKLIIEKPIYKISIRELCEQATVSRGTFYLHYEDIYQLQDEIEDAMMQELIERVQTLKEQDYEHYENSVMTVIFQCLCDHADVCEAMLGPNGDRQFLAKLLTFGKKVCVESHIHNLEEADEKELEYFYTFISAGCIGLLRKWIINDRCREDAVKVAKIAEDIIDYGSRFINKKAN